MKELREYQKEAVDSVMTLFATHDSVMLVSPTGAGKSVMAGAIAYKYQAILIVAHRRELLDQIAKNVRFSDVVTTTIQSVHNMTHNIADFDLVIIDECHHCTTKSYKRLTDAIKKENVNAGGNPIKLLGLTATPIRSDNAPLKSVFEAVHETPQIEELQAMGHLVVADEVSLSHFDFTVTMKTRKARKMPSRDLLSKKVREVVVAGDILHNYENVAKGQTIIYCVDLAHAKEVDEMLRENGHESAYISGGTAKQARDNIIEDFISKKINVVCNCMLLTEGLDFPECETVMLVRPTQSLSLYMQMAGRALRPFKGKKKAIIIDHVGNWHIHGSINKNVVWDYDTRFKSSGGQEGDQSGISNSITKIFTIDTDLVEQKTYTPMFSKLLEGATQ